MSSKGFLCFSFAHMVYKYRIIWNSVGMSAVIIISAYNTPMHLCVHTHTHAFALQRQCHCCFCASAHLQLKLPVDSDGKS